MVGLNRRERSCAFYLPLKSVMSCLIYVHFSLNLDILHGILTYFLPFFIHITLESVHQVFLKTAIYFLIIKIEHCAFLQDLPLGLFVYHEKKKTLALSYVLDVSGILRTCFPPCWHNLGLWFLGEVLSIRNCLSRAQKV